MSYIDKRRKAFKYAGRGFGSMLKNEAHAKIHFFAAVAVIIAGFIFDVTSTEWCLIALCIGGVFMAEAFNTAIEKLADRISRDHDPLIGSAKDVAAGAVLIMAIAAAIVGCIIFIPKIIGLW